ncbi:MAG: SHOCT domain-containing protein [Dehalococcoidales bacterium]|nr:SHOCT domain-containing protein [Dehalococcoidales bacterium]
MFWMMNGFDRGWWWVGGIFMLLFWGGIIALVIWGISRMTHRGMAMRHMHMGHMGAEEPLDIAKARYAKGEITKEQFEQIKKDLM